VTKVVAAAPASVAAYDDSALKQQLADQASEIAKLKAQPAPAPVVAEPAKADTKDNMVFFRGGFAHSNKDRNGVSIASGVAPVGAQERADKDAWYMGAGFDFSVSDDLFGLAKGTGTEVMAELMFDYKEFGVVQGNALANTPTQLAGGALNPRSVTVNQFTLAASPKIKFLKGQDFRPWIQPVGFALQVVSPPTESITVLQPAMMFGVGADYRLWNNIYIGADARYHQALGGTMDGVNTNGFTAGGYIGLGF
jgi:opacity protein-like surface antigen